MSRFKIIFSSFLASLFCAVLPMKASADISKITVAKENWGGASEVDILQVLLSASNSLAKFLPSTIGEEIIVRYRENQPLLAYERGPNNEYLVFLSAKGLFWAQFAYQFSHEACHILTNASPESGQPWFDEVACGIVSYFVLKDMAASWRKSAPYLHWTSYASSLDEYAEQVKANWQNLAPPPPFAKWFNENPGLRIYGDWGGTRRAITMGIAHHMFPAFSNPNDLQELTRLNLDSGRASNQFDEYLSSWTKSLPNGQGKIPAKIKALLQNN